MKKLNYVLSAIVLLGVLVTVGCSKDDGPSQTAGEIITEKLSKTWTLTSVTLDNDGATASDLITPTPLTVSFTESSYSTNSGTVERSPNPWPVSGAWSFKEEPTDANASFTITREDGLELLAVVTDTSLTLTFTFVEGTHTAGGKEEAVGGSWVMGFTAP